MSRTGASPSYNGGRLRGWDRSCLRPDVFAGLSVAAYLVPQVMAYATLAGLEPVVGLWACLIPLVVYAVVGTSRLLSVGPESTTSILTAAALAPLALGDPGTYAAMATLCALVVGVLALAAGVLRLGFIAQLLSRPVLSGYLAGVAVIMICGQLGRVMGTDVEGAHPIEQLLSAIRAADAVHWPTLAIGVAVVVTLVLGTRSFPKLPWPLLAVLGATAATVALDLAASGVQVVGDTFLGRTYAPHVTASANENLRLLRSVPQPTPEQMQQIVRETAERMGVDPRLALGHAYTESRFRMASVSPGNAVGAMQVIPITGEFASELVGRELNLLDPYDNAVAGVAFIKYVQDRTPTLDEGIGAYYQGLGGVLDSGLNPEARDYVAKVRAAMAMF